MNEKVKGLRNNHGNVKLSIDNVNHIVISYAVPSGYLNYRGNYIVNYITV